MPDDVDDPDDRADDGSSPTPEEIVAENLELQEQLHAAGRLRADDPPALDAQTVAVLRARLGARGASAGPPRDADLPDADLPDADLPDVDLPDVDLPTSRAERDATVLTLATGILMERHQVDMIRAGVTLVSAADHAGLDPVAYARAVVRAVADRPRS